MQNVKNNHTLSVRHFFLKKIFSSKFESLSPPNVGLSEKSKTKVSGKTTISTCFCISDALILQQLNRVKGLRLLRLSTSWKQKHGQNIRDTL